MALTGIQIFKFLPGAKKTSEANCKKCGCPTCMVYAMKLAKGQTTIDTCPFVDEELIKIFATESKKPQEKIEFGITNKVVIGDEIVMFRHDKTFINPCCFAIKLNSDDKDFDNKLSNILNYSVERIGETFKVNAIALVEKETGFETNAKKLFKSDIPVILIAENIKSLNNIMDLIKSNKPLVYLKSQNIDELCEIKKNAPIIVDGETPKILSHKSEQLLSLDCKNIVLNLKQKVNSKIIEPLTMIRRSAIEKKYEPLGFPVMNEYNLSDNLAKDMACLSTLVCKYSNLIVMDNLNPAILNALITLRMNIYTDPQKPLQVEPKLYEIGDVTPNSKVMVTTNFALTYFAVVNELEALSEGVYLIITNSDGMSVLTAWSATKLTGEIIAKAVKDSGIEEKVNHKNLIIPGLVADLADEIKEELPDYNIIIGTSEATDIPDFMKNLS